MSESEAGKDTFPSVLLKFPIALDLLEFISSIVGSFFKSRNTSRSAHRYATDKFSVIPWTFEFEDCSRRTGFCTFIHDSTGGIIEMIILIGLDSLGPVIKAEHPPKLDRVSVFLMLFTFPSTVAD